MRAPELKLPQSAALSGQMFFHRFYYKVSFKRFDVENTSMAALFLDVEQEVVERMMNPIASPGTDARD